MGFVDAAMRCGHVEAERDRYKAQRDQLLAAVAGVEAELERRIAAWGERLDHGPDMEADHMWHAYSEALRLVRERGEGDWQVMTDSAIDAVYPLAAPVPSKKSKPDRISSEGGER